jgi:hypothetical protein
MNDHYAWDYHRNFVHIVRDHEVRARCGSEVKAATTVMGAKVCLGCVVVEKEEELHRYKNELYLYGKGGKPA